MINLLDSTGQPVVGPDPEGKVVFPVFRRQAVPAGSPKAFEALEFGNELALFNARKCPVTEAQSSSGRIVKQAFSSKDWRVPRFRKDEGSHPPAPAHGKGRNYPKINEYQHHEVLQEPDLKVFAVPPGITCQGLSQAESLLPFELARRTCRPLPSSTAQGRVPFRGTGWSTEPLS